ncbi:MAG: 2-hydroxyacid dehydrogenase [Acidimicrobiales bacterium]
MRGVVVARVLVTRPLPPGSLEPLEGHEITILDPWAAGSSALAEVVRDLAPEAIVCTLNDRIDAGVIDAGTAGRGRPGQQATGQQVQGDGSRLRVVANVAVGYDNIDVAAASARGVLVCNTPGVLDETTADLAFALILAASRRMSDAESDLRAGRWGGWALDGYLGRDAHGATLGLVGFGRTARAVARRAEGFSMKVLHHSRTATGVAGYMADLDSMLAISDIVSLHVPLSIETHHLIDARRLDLMKPSAVLVNTARGPVVDEAALADALVEGRIFAAGLDVYENEPAVHPRLLAAPHTVLLPHVGSASTATRTAMARTAAEGAADALAGRPPAHLLR